MWYCVYGRWLFCIIPIEGLKLEPTVPPPCLVHIGGCRLGDDQVLPPLQTVCHIFRSEGLVGFGIFQQTINMNARFVDEGFSPTIALQVSRLRLWLQQLNKSPVSIPNSQS